MMTSNKTDGEDFLKLVQRLEVLESISPTLKDIPAQFEAYDEYNLIESEPESPIEPKPLELPKDRQVDPFELPEAEPLSNKDLNRALNTVTIQRDILQEHNDFLRPQVAILAEQLRVERRLRFANMWLAIGVAVRWRSSEVALAQTLKENFHL